MKKTVAVLKNLGERLQSDERPPYVLDEHDESINFDEPTADLIEVVREPRREEEP